jgi:iron complex transport system substrate-binding protein
VILLLPVLFSLPACQQGENQTIGDTREVVDILGRTVVIPQTVDRIFVDWPSGVTLPLTLGAADKLVLIQEQFRTEMHAWARIIVPELENIPAENAPASNVEVILKYQPQVIFTNTVTTHVDDDWYKGIGIPVVAISFDSIDDFMRSMTIVGDVLGGQYKDAAARFNDFFNDNVMFVTERLKDISEPDMMSIYYADSRRSNALYTIGAGEMQEAWINIAGGKLATAEYFEGRNIDITAEMFLSIDPDIILVGGQNQAITYDLIVSDPVLRELTAVGSGQVFRIPQGIFPWCRTGTEVSLQVIWTAKLLFPDLFEDVDISKIAKDFYRDFFGADVSDENIAKILQGRLSPSGE